MDGSGYPLHLEKEHLTLADRIISIADIFTALTEDRPYRKGMAAGSLTDYGSGCYKWRSG